MTYPGYRLNPVNFTLIPSDEKTVDLKELLQLLVSNANDYDPEKFDWIF